MLTDKAIIAGLEEEVERLTKRCGLLDESVVKFRAEREKRSHKPTGWATPHDRYAVPALFNPYTGEPRDARDIASDPHGQLIVPPGCVDMYAAQEKP